MAATVKRVLGEWVERVEGWIVAFSTGHWGVWWSCPLLCYPPPIRVSTNSPNPSCSGRTQSRTTARTRAGEGCQRGGRGWNQLRQSRGLVPPPSSQGQREHLVHSSRLPRAVGGRTSAAQLSRCRSGRHRHLNTRFVENEWKIQLFYAPVRTVEVRDAPGG